MISKFREIIFGKKESTFILDTQPPKLMFKLILIGDESRKTVKFRNSIGATLECELLDSIGTDFCVRTIIDETGKIITQIWEISQEKKFIKIRKKFMSGAKGGIVIFDTLDPNSLINQVEILNEIYSQTKTDSQNTKNFPLLLVACNSDLADGTEIIKEFDNLLNFSDPSNIYLTTPDCDNFVSVENFIDEFVREIKFDV